MDIATDQKEFEGVVTAVHDGDTFTARIALPLGLSLTDHVRMVGIDAPELPTPEGLNAKSYLTQRLLNRSVRLVLSHELRDKYGRLLGEVFDFGAHPGVSVNSDMLRLGFACVYPAPSRP